MKEKIILMLINHSLQDLMIREVISDFSGEGKNPNSFPGKLFSSHLKINFSSQISR